MIFKAWDKENKGWVMTKSSGMSFDNEKGKPNYRFSQEFDFDSLETIRLIRAFPANYSIIRYTGRKDKMGVKIFEGDIIQFKVIEGFRENDISQPEFHFNIGLVYWAEGNAGFAIMWGSEYSTFSLENANSYVVIGNKFDDYSLVENFYENLEEEI